MSLWYNGSDSDLVKAVKLAAWSVASPVVVTLIGAALFIVCMAFGMSIEN